MLRSARAMPESAAESALCLDDGKTHTRLHSLVSIHSLRTPQTWKVTSARAAGRKRNFELGLPFTFLIRVWPFLIPRRSRSPSSSSLAARLFCVPAQSSVQAFQRVGTSVSLRRIDRACYQDRCDAHSDTCLLYTSPSPRDKRQSRMPSSA